MSARRHRVPRDPIADRPFVQAPEGQRLPVTPEFKANLTARYEFPLGGLDSFTPGAWVYQATRRRRCCRRGRCARQAGRVHARGSRRSASRKSSWRAELFVENALDERASSPLCRVRRVSCGVARSRRTRCRYAACTGLRFTNYAAARIGADVHQHVLTMRGMSTAQDDRRFRRSRARRRRRRRARPKTRGIRAIPERVSLAYTVDSAWRNRAEFFSGRPAIVEFLNAQMGEGTRLPPDQGSLGLRGRAHRGALRVRVARRLRPLVPLVRQRELGVRRARAHAPASREHQRPGHHRSRAQVSLAAGARPDDHPGLSDLGSRYRDAPRRPWPMSGPAPIRTQNLRDRRPFLWTCARARFSVSHGAVGPARRLPRCIAGGARRPGLARCSRLFASACMRDVHPREAR